MNAQQAELTIAAPLPAVRHVLLRPLEFPEWNPAFSRLTGPSRATVGVRHPLTVRPGLSGEFWYAAITETHIEARWTVPGMAEVGTWDLHEHGGHAVVIHAFEHTGPLATLLSRGFRGVAELRLARLADRALAPPVSSRR